MSRADMSKITHTYPAIVTMEPGGAPNNCEAVLSSFLQYAAVHQVEHLTNPPSSSPEQRTGNPDKSLLALLRTKMREQPGDGAHQLELALLHAKSKYEKMILPSNKAKIMSPSTIPTPQPTIWPWSHPGRPSKGWEEPTPALLIDDERLPDVPRLYFWNYACTSCVHHPQLLANLELGDIYGLSLRILQLSKNKRRNRVIRRSDQTHDVKPLEICQHFLYNQSCKYETPHNGIWCRYSHGTSNDKHRAIAKKAYRSRHTETHTMSATKTQRSRQPATLARHQAEPPETNRTHTKVRKVSDKHHDATGQPNKKPFSQPSEQARALVGLFGDTTSHGLTRTSSISPPNPAATTNSKTRSLITNNNGVFEWDCSQDNALSTRTPPTKPN